MNTVIKIIGSFFTLVFALLGLLTVYIVLINASDSALSGNNLTLRDWLSHPHIAIEDNAFEQARNLVGSPTSPILSFSDQQQQLLVDYKQACYQADVTKCQQFIGDEQASIAQTLTVFQQSIAQFDALALMQHWQEQHGLEQPRQQLDFDGVVKLKSLSEMRLLSEVGHSPQQVLDYLGLQYSFLLKVFLNAQYLDSHIQARSLLEQNLQMAQMWRDEFNLQTTQYWQSSMQLKLEHIQQILAGEWLFSHHTIAQLTRQPFSLTDTSSYPDALFGYFLQQNDSDNMNADYFVAIADYVAGNTESIDNHAQAYCLDQTAAKIWHMRYNPVGKILNCLNKHNYLTTLIDESKDMDKLRQTLVNSSESDQP